MFGKIVAPLDGSVLAASVLPHVVALVQATGAQVTLLRVMGREANALSAISPVDWQLQKTEAQIYLDELSSRLTPLLTPPPAVLLLEGHVADRIIEYAKQNECDLVVLSSHGQSGLHSWNVSSITQKVLARVGRSVLLIRAYQMDTSQLSEWDGMRYRRIIVPLDGSPRAEHVLPIATALAGWHGAELMLVHVVTRPTMIQRMPLTAEDSALAEQLFERNQTQAHKYLEQLRLRLNPEPQIHLITGENVPATLHRFVNQQGTDLVIMSAHGHSAQRQWPYGSLAMSFVEHGATSLLLLQDMPPNTIEPTAAELAAEANRKQPTRPVEGNGQSTNTNGIQVETYVPAPI
jgi:nucleotide-binding universal stress UspA family protein